MKKFVGVLMNIRIVTSEVGSTLGLVFLIAYGTYKAWEDFGAKVFK
jgi:hypothetical protein